MTFTPTTGVVIGHSGNANCSIILPGLKIYWKLIDRYLPHKCEQDSLTVVYWQSTIFKPSCPMNSLVGAFLFCLAWCHLLGQDQTHPEGEGERYSNVQ